MAAVEITGKEQSLTGYKKILKAILTFSLIYRSSELVTMDSKNPPHCETKQN
jgi:hypothetical protein